MTVSPERTMVGVPFYDGEGFEVMHACLKNVDACLNRLGIDAEVVMAVNGPHMSRGLITLSNQLNRGDYNAEIGFILTPPGQVQAEKAIGRYANERNYKRIFITDADISRLPQSFLRMWNQGDKPLVGTSYATYPPPILIGSGMQFSPEELKIMQILEADKHPHVRQFVQSNRPAMRLKGSLLMLDPRIIETMFGDQSITPDSSMNRHVADKDKQLIANTGFFHFARFDVTDHIRARLRHFRAAEAENDLVHHQERVMIYQPEQTNRIAQQIQAMYPGEIGVVSDFLIKCAFRDVVTSICSDIASGKREAADFIMIAENAFKLNEVVLSYEQALVVAKQMLRMVDWENLEGAASHGGGVTQSDRSRIPIDLTPFMQSTVYQEMIRAYLGINTDEEL